MALDNTVLPLPILLYCTLANLTDVSSRISIRYKKNESSHRQPLLRGKGGRCFYRSKFVVEIMFTVLVSDYCLMHSNGNRYKTEYVTMKL